MAKHKNKIIAALAAAALLTGAWLFGGNYNKDGAAAPPSPAMTAAQAAEAPPGDGQPATPPEAPDSLTGAATEPGTTPETPSASATGASPPAVNDKYLTGPTPPGKPLPVEPQDMAPGDASFTVTLSVGCGTILGNMSLLNKEKWELVPEDGVIFPATEVAAYEGESVFNLLQREMKRAKIHLEFMNTPIYNSAYIEGINNIYEFEAGELSGWMYQVNGWYPNYGCGRYLLKPGDVVEWHYTCDLGKDLEGGAVQSGGWQRDE